MSHPLLEEIAARMVAHADLLIDRYNLNRMKIALRIGQIKSEMENENQDSDSRGGMG